MSAQLEMENSKQKENQKVVLITGTSSGIGKVTLEKLVKDGHIVYGTVRKEADKKIVEDLGGKPIVVEMTDYGSLERTVNKVISEQGRIDALYNNAGYGLYGAVEDVSMEDAHHQFEVNLFGLARLTQLVIPHMRKQKSGKIINTSFMGGKIYTPFGAWYHATKHALEGWSDCLRVELKPFGIDVVVIEPGAIETNFIDAMSGFVERSKGGAYEESINKMMSSMSDANGNPRFTGSPPSVIADVVSQAINTERPKTRYMAGRMAGTMLFIRRWFGDRGYDWFLSRQFA